MVMILLCLRAFLTWKLKINPKSLTMHVDPVSSGPYLLFHPNLWSFLSDTPQTLLAPDVCNCLALLLGSSAGYSLLAHPLWLVTPAVSFCSQNGWLHPQGSLPCPTRIREIFSWGLTLAAVMALTTCHVMNAC